MLNSCLFHIRKIIIINEKIIFKNRYVVLYFDIPYFKIITNYILKLIIEKCPLKLQLIRSDKNFFQKQVLLQSKTIKANKQL